MNKTELRVASCQLPVNTGGLRAVYFDSQLATRNSQLSQHWQLSAGFTLMELMVSIALVIVLMVGIGKIFKMTSDTVGGGMAISNMARGDRSAQVTMQNDFAGAANDSPVFMILSERASAWLTQQDKLSDTDGNPMTVPDKNGSETASATVVQSQGGSAVSPGIYGDRNHRVDRIGFFARGAFNRQTSNDNNEFTPDAPTSTTEAYIWYGHLRMFNTATTSVGPAMTQNTNGADDYSASGGYPIPGYKTGQPNQPDTETINSACYEGTNAIASNWVLGRVAIGLMDKNAIPKAAAGNPPTSCYAIGPGAPNVQSVSSTSKMLLPPFDERTQATDETGAALPTGTSSNYYPVGGSSGPCYIYSSRFDLAATTISEFRSIVSSAYYASQTNPTTARPWWWPMAYEGVLMGPQEIFPQTTPPTYKPPVSAVSLRFECNPAIGKPMTGTGMALATPYFLPHVTQFIVEYAGDFLTQNDPAAVGATSGQITAIAPDGKLDFYYDQSADPYYHNPSVGGAPTPSLWVRKIRWYGFPRDASGYTVTGSGANPVTTVGPDGTIPSLEVNGTMTNGNGGYSNMITDVVPFRDIARTFNAAYTSSWEVEVPTQRDDYAQLNTSNSLTNAGSGLAGNEHYYCVWRNAAPKLIRILMKIDDPNGRVQQGRWIEQVFAIQ